MRKTIYLLAVICLIGCQHNNQQALEQLQQVRQQHRLAHINRDANLLVSTFADNFYLVQDGRVAQPGSEDSLAQFQPYFDSVTFVAWDDLAPPIITLSNDRQMASVIVSKLVRIVPRHDEQAEGQQTIFAWLETWQRHNGEWQIKVLASTQQPSPEPSAEPSPEQSPAQS